MSQSVLLKIIEGKLSGEEFVFEDNGPYLIGRAHSCALRFSDDVDLKMSRRHLILVLDDDEMRIRDLGSRNGTEVNGTRLPVGKINKVPEAKTAEDYVLKPGDVVKIGNLAFAFEFTEKTASSLSPLISSKTPGEKAIAKLPQVGFKKPASSSKPALNVEPAAAKPSLPVEAKPEPETPSKAAASPDTLDTRPKEPVAPPQPAASDSKPAVEKTKPAITPIGLKKPALSSKPALNVEPAAAKPSLPVESKSESEKTVKPLPVLLTPKITGKKLNLKQSNDSTKVPISTNPLLTLKKGDAKPSSPSDSIVEKDVFEKLGTLDETVAMEPVEFDNLDDLVFHAPEKKEGKRSAKFKIKHPGPRASTKS